MKLHFREITPNNWKDIRLEVHAHQKGSVAAYTTTLARAYVYRRNKSVALALYLDETPIGLLMQRDYTDCENTPICILDQFFIDKNYQGKGHGTAALKLWLDNVKRTNKYQAVQLCFLDGYYAAQSFYENLGFVRKPQLDDGDELVMTLPLPDG